MKPYALKVDGREAPMEVDRPSPRFTWRLQAEPGDSAQATFALEIEETGRGIVWTSGTMAGDEVSAHYAGPPLRSCTEYVWRVTVTDTSGRRCSAGSQFETGLLSGDRPDAAWIGQDQSPWFDATGRLMDDRPPSELVRSWRTMYSAAPLQLRRNFLLPSAPSRARLLITARGIYRAYINGERVGHDELTPGWTRYENRIEYQRYDVTKLLTSDENVLAVEVADGWWSGYLGYDTRSQALQYGSSPALVAELMIENADGRLMRVVTDGEWRERPGGRVSADLLMGESQDASLATPGWRAPGFDDSRWRRALVVDADLSPLSGQVAEPVRCVEELLAIGVDQSDERVIVDFGQNVTGRVRINLESARDGDVVTVRHGEMLDAGELYMENLRTAEATDRYLLAGTSQTLEPVFTFHGFRFAEITGLRGPVRADQFTAVVLSSALENTGTVHTSSGLVNQLMRNVRRSQVGNFVALPTDCPQRDERLGWTADAQVFAPTAAYNQDVEAFFRSWLNDLQASQTADGGVPDVAPVPPRSLGFRHGAPGWGDAATILPWTLFRQYGDLERLRSDFSSMRSWVDHIRQRNSGQLWTEAVGNHFGDWLAVDAETPKDLVAAAYQVRSADLTAAAAHALGDPSASDYEEYAETLRDLFLARFIDTDGDLVTPTQTGYLFTLAWELTPAETRVRLAEGLVADVEAHGRRLTTGFHGVALLCPILTEVGRPDLAYAILLQEQFPSWGYSIAHGATSIWERWDGWTTDHGFQTVTMNSFNHYSLGSVGEWIYASVAGIAQDPASVGWRRLRIAPQFTQHLSEVDAAFETPRGRAQVRWTRVGTHFEVAVNIPPGASASVELPMGQAAVGAGLHHFQFDVS